MDSKINTEKASKFGKIKEVIIVLYRKKIWQ